MLVPVAVLTLFTATDVAPRVALVPVVGAGLAADEVARDESLMRREVDAHFGAQSVPGSDVHARLDQAASVGLQCDRAEVACLVQLGVVCQADVVLLPILNGTSFAFRLVDVGEAQQIAYASTSLAGPLRAEDVSALLARLEQADAKKITVDVTGPAGAKVVIDGAEVAHLPLDAALPNVKAGKHEVRVVGDDIFSANVDVRPGEPVVVRAPVKASFPTLWVVGGGIVATVGVVAGVVGVVPYFQNQSAAADLQRLESEVGSDAAKAKQNAAAIQSARSTLDASRSAWSTTSAPLIVGGTVAVVAGALIIATPFVLE